MERDVFVSYSSHDDALATAIREAFEAAGMSCFVASRDLPGRAGHAYSGEIVAAIDESRAMLLLLSADANQSEHVLGEVELARNRRLPILPVVIDGALPSRNFEYYIRSLQWFVISGFPDAARLGELALAMRGLIDAAPERLQPATTAATRSHLPVPPNALIGRDDDVARASELARTSQLLTIHAAGGVGKTHFAIELATRISSRFTDGAWFVDLTSVAEESVATAVAETVGVRARPDQPVLSALVEALRDLNALIVLDNCEHVVAAAANLVVACTASAPALRFIATSRDLLSVAVERVFSLDPLRVPEENVPLDVARGYSAIVLFVERAERIRPGVADASPALRDVIRICRRLDGIPLAIELAAARTALFDARELDRRLDNLLPVLTSRRRDSSERQRTVENLVAWSYRLLSALEMRVFVRLATFAGPWSLDAAVQVISAPSLDALDVEDSVSSLLEKSLVTRGPDDRFRLYEVVRAYAKSLGGDAAAELRDAQRRHITYFADYSEACCRRYRATGDSRELGPITAELADVREALERALGDAEQSANAARLAVSLGSYGLERGLISEVYERVRAASALPNLTDASRAEIALLIARCAVLAGDMHEARRRFGELIERSDPAMRGFALQGLAEIERKEGRFDEALRLVRESLIVTEPLANRTNYVVGLAELANVEIGMGDRAGARATLLRARDVAQEIGDPSLTTVFSGMLAMAAYAEGDLESASALLDEAVTATTQFGLRPSESWFRSVRAEISFWLSDFVAARSDALLALEAAVETGYLEPAARTAETLGALAGSSGNQTAARTMFAWAAATRTASGIVLDPDDQAVLLRKLDVCGLTESGVVDGAMTAAMSLGGFLDYARTAFGSS